MAAKTIQRTLRDGTTTLGGVVVLERAGYIKIQMPNHSLGMFYFLGPSGSFRYGRSRTNSRVVSDKTRAKFLEAGQIIMPPSLEALGI